MVGRNRIMAPVAGIGGITLLLTHLLTLPRLSHTNTNTMKVNSVINKTKY
jgi:hypothetical protein